MGRASHISQHGENAGCARQVLSNLARDHECLGQLDFHLRKTTIQPQNQADSASRFRFCPCSRNRVAEARNRILLVNSDSQTSYGLRCQIFKAPNGLSGQPWRFPIRATLDVEEQVCTEPQQFPGRREQFGEYGHFITAACIG